MEKPVTILDAEFQRNPETFEPVVKFTAVVNIQAIRTTKDQLPSTEDFQEFYRTFGHSLMLQIKDQLEERGVPEWLQGAPSDDSTSN